MDTLAIDGLINRSRRYAGIGSRTVPNIPAHWMERFGAMLGSRGLTLRSGAALGSDAAFERGAEYVEGKQEILLPWPRYNEHPSPLAFPSPEAEALAATLHPNWKACDQAARRMHARNCQQILGPNLDTPVDFVLFYARETASGVWGGTATAVNLAQRHGIPTYNIWSEPTMEVWQAATRLYERSRTTFWLDLFK